MDYPNQNGKRTLTLIGLGAMGLPIAKNLMKAGFKLKIYTKSGKAESIENLEGSIICKSPMDSAENSELIIICISDENAVEEVLFGSKGLYRTLKPGQKVIDLSTISPRKAKEFASRLSRYKVSYFDAPITGGTEGAKSGALTIFVGAHKDQIKDILSILNIIGNSIYTFNEVGKGQEVKALNQILVAGSMAAAAEAIALGQKLNLPMGIVLEALQKGAGGSWSLKNRSKSMLNDSYPLGFKLGLHNKDLEIAIKTANSSGLSLPVTSKVKQIEESLIRQGYTNEDVSVIRKAIK